MGPEVGLGDSPGAGRVVGSLLGADTRPAPQNCWSVFPDRVGNGWEATASLAFSQRRPLAPDSSGPSRAARQPGEGAGGRRGSCDAGRAWGGAGGGGLPAASRRGSQLCHRDSTAGAGEAACSCAHRFLSRNHLGPALPGLPSRSFRSDFPTTSSSRQPGDTPPTCSLDGLNRRACFLDQGWGTVFMPMEPPTQHAPPPRSSHPALPAAWGALTPPPSLALR